MSRFAILGFAIVVLAACQSDADHSCGGPTPECQSLCQAYCSALLMCGMSVGDCQNRCFASYKCPGETPGQDEAICRSESTAVAGRSCDDNCKRSSAWSGCVVADAAPGVDTGASPGADLDASE